MDKETAKYTLVVAYKAYSELLHLVPTAIPYIENYMERDDIEAKLYKGIFGVSHKIIEEILNVLIEEYPELDTELEATIKRFKRLP